MDDGKEWRRKEYLVKGEWRTLRRVMLGWQRVTEGFVVVAEK